MDDLEMIKKDENKTKNYTRILQKGKARDDGYAAYFDAVNDGTYHAICSYRAKDLKSAWVSGYKEAEKIGGGIDAIIYA